MQRLRKFLLLAFKCFLFINLLHAAEFVHLPHTDGQGLKPPLAPPSAQQKQLMGDPELACQQDCVTPFGSKLGQADGVIGYSNCQSICVKPEYSFLNLQDGRISNHLQDPKDNQLHYIGVIYQCVEYARKWWMKNFQITFPSIDSAYQILYLTESENIYTHKKAPLARSINGSAKKAPKRGDLLIYAPDRNNPNWIHGHVAVIVKVNIKKGVIYVAEENYDNKPWQDPLFYSRKLTLLKNHGAYSVLDKETDQKKNKQNGIISGWIYPYLINEDKK